MVRGDMKIKICERIQRGWGGTGPAAAPPVRELPSEAKAAPSAPAPAAVSPPPSLPEPPAYLLKVNPRRYYALKRAYDQEVAARAKMAELGIAETTPEEMAVEQEDEEVALLNPAAAKRRRVTSGRGKAAYELRKRLAVASFELYMDRVLSEAPHLLNRELRLGWRKYTQKKRRDVSDAVLQGVYVIARELKLV